MQFNFQFFSILHFFFNVFSFLLYLCVNVVATSCSIFFLCNFHSHSGSNELVDLPYAFNAYNFLNAFIRQSSFRISVYFLFIFFFLWLESCKIEFLFHGMQTFIWLNSVNSQKCFKIRYRKPQYKSNTDMM